MTGRKFVFALFLYGLNVGQISSPGIKKRERKKVAENVFSNVTCWSYWLFMGQTVVDTMVYFNESEEKSRVSNSAEIQAYARRREHLDVR